MASSYLTATEITREALTILHAKLRFISGINRQYDDRFANEGASVSGKIGPTLQIRLPNKFTVRSGITMSVQDVAEEKVDLTVSTVKGVDMEFGSVDLALKLQDFSERFIQPAISVLASNIEADVLSNVYKDVYNLAGTAGTVPSSLSTYLAAKRKLNEFLAPDDSKRTMMINSEAEAATVDNLKGLFQDASSVAKQYKEGVMGRTVGFEWVSSDLIPTHTNGTQSGTFTVNGASQSGASLNVNGMGANKTLKAGTVLSIADVYAVHPETHSAYTSLQQFVVTADVTATSGGTATLALSPSIVAASGAYTTVNSLPLTGAVITPVGSASTGYAQNLAFHKNAFTFVTADLELPKGVDFAARKMMDGISLSIVRDFSITGRTFPCRIDVLYGYKTIRPQLACRLTA